MKFYLPWAAWLLLTACGEESDRQEQLTKLRGLGAAANPLVSQPSVSGQEARKVELSVYAALPLGHTATIKAFKDEANSSALVLETDQIELKPETVAYEAYAGFQILSFKALVSVPEAKSFARTGGAGQVRYGFEISDGDEKENVVGNFLVYPEGAAELAWQHPEVTITSHSAGAKLAAGAKLGITANLTNTNQEDLKLGWFASGGKIQNRWAKSTIWQTPSAGPQTLIVTVRGKKSRGFAWRILSVQAE